MALRGRNIAIFGVMTLALITMTCLYNTAQITHALNIADEQLPAPLDRVPLYNASARSSDELLDLVRADLNTRELRPRWDATYGLQVKVMPTVDCRNMDGDTNLSCERGWRQIAWLSCEPPDDQKGVAFGIPICSPAVSSPNRKEVTWRGGELTDSKVCNGQCWEDEVTLLVRPQGGSPSKTPIKRCGKGEKALCAKSGHWSRLEDSCYLSGCNEPCGRGAVSLAKIFDTIDCNHDKKFLGKPKQYCCPEPSKFERCYWAGRNKDCSRNYCFPGDFEMMQHSVGSGPRACPPERTRTLCCTGIQESPFLPVSDEIDLFPGLPPANDYVNWEFGWPLGKPPAGDPNGHAFGWLIIESPTQVAASAKTKRHAMIPGLTFLDCIPAVNDERPSVRFICTSDADDSGNVCYNIMREDLRGTILKMPPSCTDRQHIVIHDVRLAQDQSIPQHVSVTGKTVYELVYNVNSNLTRRDSGDTYFRADYSNVLHYWEAVVDGPPVHVHKNFWSDTVEAWQSVFGRWLGFPGPGTVIEQYFNETILSETVECDSGTNAYAEIKVSGKVKATIKTSATVYGILAPLLHIEHASVFTSTEIDAEMDIEVSAAGKFSTNGEQLYRPLFGEKNNNSFISGDIVAIKPYINADIALFADFDMNANFTTSIRMSTGKGGKIVQAFPRKYHEPRGSVTGLEPDPATAFNGFVDTNDLDSKLQLTLLSNAGVHIEVSPSLGHKRDGAHGTGNLVNALIASKMDLFAGTERFNVTQKMYPAYGALRPIDGFDPFGLLSDGDERSRKIGDGYPQYLDLRHGLDKSDNGRGPPQHPIRQQQGAAFAGAVAKTCTRRDGCCVHAPYKCIFRLCEFDSELCKDTDMIDGDNPRPSGEKRDINGTLLLPRGASRSFRVDFNTGPAMTIKSRGYPGRTFLFEGSEGAPLLPIKVLDYVDEADCTNTGVQRGDEDQQNKYVTEHILELQTIGEFIQAASSGELPGSKKLPQGLITQAYWFRFNWNAFRLPSDPYKKFAVPNDLVFEALGSWSNRQNFVLARDEINSVKARIWMRSNPRTPLRMAKAVDDWIVVCDDPAKFLKYLKATRSVFKYIEAVQRQFNSEGDKVTVELQYIMDHVYDRRGLGNLVEAWKQYMNAFFDDRKQFAKSWMLSNIQMALQKIQQAQLNNKCKVGNAAEVSAALGTLANSVGGINFGFR